MYYHLPLEVGTVFPWPARHVVLKASYGRREIWGEDQELSMAPIPLSNRSKLKIPGISGHHSLGYCELVGEEGLYENSYLLWKGALLKLCLSCSSTNPRGE